MTQTEEMQYIDSLHDRAYTPVEDDIEPVWCDNCGKDLPFDGYTAIYQIPGREECYCENCFPLVVFDDCIIQGSSNEKRIISALQEVLK